MPTILSQEEVARLIDAARPPLHREIVVHHLPIATFFALSFHALAHSFIFRIL